MIVLLVVFAAAPCHEPALGPSLPQTHPQPATMRRDGKPPIIVIPGMLGSRLVNRRTGKTLWPDLRVDEDEIALPTSSSILVENTDEVAATEIVGEARFNPLVPAVPVYNPLLKALERYGGYRRGSFIAPPSAGDRDTFYVFAYDWRRDIVESARLLGCAIEDLKRRLRRPDLRFDIVAHSMGGLVARYYAMYGERDVLNDQVYCPDWAGARNLGWIVMIGAPNAGSMNAFRALLRGYSVTDLTKPSGGFISRVKRALPVARAGPRVTFTMPAVYQLLPPRGQARFFDASLAPLAVELYKVETWRRYKWSVAFDERARERELKRLIERLGPTAGRVESARLAAERERFLRVALRRAAAFHAALAVNSLPAANLRFFFIGGDCDLTLDGAVVKTGATPRAIFNPSDHPGEKWQKRKVRRLIFSPGDGTITRHSLFGQSLNPRPAEAIPAAMRSTPVTMALSCRSHLGLLADSRAQSNLLTALLIRQ